MSNRIDILTDQDFDLLEDPVTNDFVEGESTRQHQALLIVCAKGSFKENPASCVDSFMFLEDDSNNANDLLREVKKQFLADGMVINNLTTTTDGKIQIDATYR